jgi:hypothetical protein
MMDKELVSLELVDLYIEESEKQEIMYQFQVSIDEHLINMKNKNSQIDKEISQLVINLHQDLLANVRTTK